MKDENIITGAVEMDTLLTVGQVAKELACPIWQVQYLLRARDIKPVCRVGVLRLFQTDIVDILQQELDVIRQRQSKTEVAVV